MSEAAGLSLHAAVLSIHSAAAFAVGVCGDRSTHLSRAMRAGLLQTAQLQLSPVSGSVVTAAVRPTPEEPRPVVLIARGDTFMIARSSCDLATPTEPSCMLRTLHPPSAAETDFY